MSLVSRHHQAIKVIPPGWQLATQAPDDLIEAMEYFRHPWM